MKFPGNNTITLCQPALMKLVEERLNNDLAPGSKAIRVTDVASGPSYSPEFKFTITTDVDHSTLATTESQS